MIYIIKCKTLNTSFADHYPSLSQAKASAARYFKSRLWERHVTITNEHGETWETCFTPGYNAKWVKK